MRPIAILCAFVLLPTAPALAQVTVDLHALQALPQRPTSPVVRPPRAAPQSREPAQTAGIAPTTGPTAAPNRQEAVTPIPPAPAPAVPEQTPQTASVEPIAPPVAAAAPPPPPVTAGAATSAAPTPAGLRLSFAPGESDLSPESADSIKQFAASGGPVTFNVQAYAPGAKDDPSSARRLSLARAMAVRSALVADGVPSVHIFVRALGTQYGSGPPDRVDIEAMNDNAAATR